MRLHRCHFTLFIKVIIAISTLENVQKQVYKVSLKIVLSVKVIICCGDIIILRNKNMSVIMLTVQSDH